MNALDSALYTKLQATAGLTSLLAGTTSIYHMQAPEGAVLPYAVFSLQGGGDQNDTANRMKNVVVFVRAYSGASAAQAGSIDAQIDTALHLQSLSVTGWTSVWLAREQDLELTENVPNGAPVYMSGGLYRVRLDKD
jgi:hypothetical protein